MNIHQHLLFVVCGHFFVLGLSFGSLSARRCRFYDVLFDASVHPTYKFYSILTIFYFCIESFLHVSDEDGTRIRRVKEFYDVQDITFAHKLVKDFAEDLEEAVVFDFSLVEKVVSFEEGPEVS